jgi:D-alanyl-D-alanine carboxypeptidase
MTLKMKKVIGIIIIILIFVIGMFFAFWPRKQEEIKINYVSGKEHIYRGQLLDPANKPSPLMKLSRRASYLNSSVFLAFSAKIAVEEMIKDAEQDGVCLVVISGYRTAKKQQQLYDQAIDKYFVALPNESEHQTGLAVDFGGCPMKNGVRNDNIDRFELAEDFNTLPEYEWLKNHAEEYGFEESFTDNNADSTGFPAEPWHWKFVIEE